jgi:hypothetical protein
MYYERNYVAAGGLLSYGSDNADFCQAGVYVGKNSERNQAR